MRSTVTVVSEYEPRTDTTIVVCVFADREEAVDYCIRKNDIYGPRYIYYCNTFYVK